METTPLILTLSNRVELLFEALRPHLFENRGGPFGKILIIVPSLAMKTWIMQQAALTQGIAFGFEVVLLNDAIRKLSSFQSVLNPIDLAIRIETELPLINAHPFPSANADIALELAELFLKYGEYHGNEMEKWASAPPHWQAELWNRIHASVKPLYLQLNNVHFPSSLPLQVHVFGFSYLSDVKQKFFENLNGKVPVSFWILSPSRMLWSDHKSEKEQYFLTALLQKQGVKFSQVQEVHGYLEESNSLIGNNGRLGRKWREKMEDIPSFTAEIYGIAATSDVDLLDGVIPFASNEITLLEAIQADLALLVKREELLYLKADDRSIEVHAAPSRYREVEALYETLLQTCASGIQPKEMLVMATSLEKYIPFIKTVFARSGSQLPFEILERTSLAESSYVRLFFALLEFGKSRFEIDPFFELLESPHFTCKNKIKLEDLHLLKTLFQKESVRWGRDRNHREELCGHPLIEKSNRGSWEGGIQKLLEALVFSEGHLSNTQSEALSSFLDLFNQLQKDLQFVSDIRPLEEWKSLLCSFLDQYLNAYQDEDEREELKNLFRKLPNKETLPFKSLLTYLKSLADETPPVMSSKNMQAVRFCPLLPMRAIPAEVIALLGMNSETFPRIERKSPLNMAETKTYIPTPTDFDRYLFLESLLSARKKWILSYLNTETKASSSVIQELLHYLDASYRLGDKKPSETLVITHSSLPHVHRKDSICTSFDLRPPLSIEELNLDLLPRHLTLMQLGQLLHNPVKHHLNHAHGIYLQDDPLHPHMEEFMEEKLWDSEWVKQALAYPMEKVLALADEKLPMAPFKEPARIRFEKNMEQWKELLSGKDIFEIEFTYDCNKLQQTGPNSWKAPAVDIAYHGKTVSITGILPYVSKEGLISLRDYKSEAIAPLLGELLLLNELPVKPQVLFLKNNKYVTAKNLSWNALLDQFLRSLHQPLPHSPAWISPILDNNPEKLLQALQKIENPYLKWAFPKVEKINCTQVIQDWKEATVKLFGDLYASL